MSGYEDTIADQIQKKYLDIRELRSFQFDIQRLIKKGDSSLLTHWDNTNITFGPASAKDKFRISQSCFVLLYRKASKKGIFDTSSSGSIEKDQDQEVLKRLKDMDFEISTIGAKANNIYSSVILCSTCNEVDIPLTHKKHKGALSEIINSFDSTKNSGVSWKSPDDSEIVWQPSGFLTYWALRSLDASKHLDIIIKNVKWMEGEVYKHIVLAESNQSEFTDAMHIGYCLAACLRYRPLLDKPTLDRPTIEKAIETIFSQQSDNGIWLRGAPILPLPDRGTVYSFSAEMLSILLGDSEGFENLYFPYKINLGNFVEWLKLNFLDDNGIKGWRSNHLPFGPPESWSTAAVCCVLDAIYKLCQKWLTDIARREFETEISEKDNLNRLWDSKITVRSGENYSLKKIIKDKLIDPIRENKGKTRSALLFGLPGTAKTSYAKAIANELKRLLLTITIGDFLTLGSTGVVRRAKEIFNLLEGTNNIIILFDEVEELVRKRTSGSERESRLLTTALLPYFQNLRNTKNLVLIATTNRLEDIDGAAIRHGRFDVVLAVAPPRFEEKTRKLYPKLPKSINKTDATKLVTKSRNTISWATYSQWKNFIKNPENYKSIDALESSLDKLSKDIQFEEKEIEKFKKLFSRID